ncbi:MAG: TPM domain-containing protein [Proteobacteria bacterium]|nr:TPM domain-containing protein [Pseudomonadota bacterium]
MKNMTDAFLSEKDREKIRLAVEKAEGRTSGEIVPMVVSSSYTYPMADVLGASALSFPLAVILTVYVCGLLWMGTPNMWVFIGFFSVLFLVFHALIKHVSGFKRFFISKREIDEEVGEAAVTAFFREGLYRTRDETGVLLFISVFERKVMVLADKGIDAHVGKDAWVWIVDHITSGIKQKRQADAICEAVTMVGDMLATHFPVKDDDTNELKNLIVES